jgi:hypothetical protein
MSLSDYGFHEDRRSGNQTLLKGLNEFGPYFWHDSSVLDKIPPQKGAHRNAFRSLTFVKM